LLAWYEYQLAYIHIFICLYHYDNAHNFFLLYIFAVLTEYNLIHLYNEWCHVEHIKQKCQQAEFVSPSGRQKFPNDEKNFRKFHDIRSHEDICYPENEGAIHKQKYACFTHRHVHITEACGAVGSSF
jgi:hypothetical protein